MRLPATLAVSFFLLAGCGLPIEPVPRTAQLHLDVARVYLSNNTICIARPVQVGDLIWEGRLEGCGVDFPYLVVLDGSRPNPLRLAAEAITGPPVRGSGLYAFGDLAILVPSRNATYQIKYPVPRDFSRRRSRGVSFGTIGIGIWRIADAGHFRTLRAQAGLEREDQ